MSDVAPAPRARRTGALLFIAALAGVAGYVLIPGDPRSRALTAEGLVAASCCLSAGFVFRAVRGRDAWSGSVHMGWALLLVGATSLLFLGLDLANPRVYEPRITDVFFLLLLVPIAGAVLAEYREHLDANDRRELEVDVLLVMASLTAILYMVLRPIGADAATSVSAAVFAVLTAAPLTAFGALTLWAPGRAHAVQFLIVLALSAAAGILGWEWTHRVFDGTAPAVDLPLIVCPLAFGALVAARPGAADARRIDEPGRWARPVLTTTAVGTACAALILFATLDDARGLGRAQSTVVIGVLGLAVAARILANQVSSAQAHREVREALRDKGAALREADLALNRVRDANQTLSESEEHLRLVFDTAVDGIVELDDRGVILRANEAFCGMVGLERPVIEGQPWSALAVAVSGADASFARLPSTGEAQIHRPEGQPLYLESRVSQMPTTPPRQLLLVRDVTAARVADQTIRSLFQFLQDRDEDRTRLLRRTNAAIEAERNRVARDLHDGPVQGVSAASLSLEAALLMIKAGETERGMDVLAKIRQELAGEADGLRRLMSGLRPPVLEERGLIPALRETLARFGADHQVQTEFAGRVSGDLPDDLETLAYRVVQEALSNVGKHAQADRVSLSVEADGGQLRVEVEDDGRGFESARAREFLREGRVGLASMRERVELASGTFVVRSTPGRGTTILATLPMDDQPAGRESMLNAAS